MWAIIRHNHKMLECFDSEQEAWDAYPVYVEGCEFDGSISVVDLNKRGDLEPQIGTLSR